MSDSRVAYEVRRLVGREIPRPVSVRAELRRWYWRFVRGYEYEICDRCGGAVGRCTGSWWGADDVLWEDVNGGFTGVMCPPCFTEACDSRGIWIAWRAVVDAE